MAKSLPKIRLPWENRWTQPTLEQLMAPLAAHHRKALETIFDEVREMPHVEMSLAWYGPSWNWTIEFRFADLKNPQPEVLCYLVAKVGAPVVSIPLTDTQFDALPLRRLNKLVREGVKLAKQAVELHWANFTPVNQTEVTHLLDLIRRKHKLVVSENATPVAKAGK